MTDAAPASETFVSREPALIWCPFADAVTAEEVVERLLDEGLIACANILPPMRSIYRWNGEKGEGVEVGVLCKTNAHLLERAVKRLEQLHPYVAPAVLGWTTDAASDAAVSWLGPLVAPIEGNSADS